MLPFDLHVLGLPPAFTLSQDQTLQLNFSASPEGLANSLSAESVQASSLLDYLHLHAFLNCLDLFEHLQMDNHPPPDARTSHLRTLSKIVGFGLSASIPVWSVTEVSDRAAHHTAVSGAVNTL